MVVKMKNKLQLVERIIDAEWRMFQKVKSAYPVSCQESPEVFRAVRSSIFELWPRQILTAYLEEIKEAESVGRNLLTEKYARMDNLIPTRNTNPLIEKIVEIEVGWQLELQKRYPGLYSRVCRLSSGVNDGSNFAVYLSCELETYGDEAIEHYYQWVTASHAKGENISIKMLEILVLRGGFSDLEHAENYFKTMSQVVARTMNSSATA